ncbi:MAG: hypothetical protein KDA64_01780 [Rhodospirillaceae bacterium]|nr:hypothetical protein [Rhodospirillaceae bacterium]
MARMKRQQLHDQEVLQPKIRLGDLAAEGINVFCWCNRCGHNAVVDTAMLAARLGPSMPVPEVGAAMRCTGCGSQDVATRPDWPSLGQVTRHGGEEAAAETAAETADDGGAASGGSGEAAGQANRSAGAGVA